MPGIRIGPFTAEVSLHKVIVTMKFILVPRDGNQLLFYNLREEGIHRKDIGGRARQPDLQMGQERAALGTRQQGCGLGHGPLPSQLVSVLSVGPVRATFRVCPALRLLLSSILMLATEVSLYFVLVPPQSVLSRAAKVTLKIPVSK